MLSKNIETQKFDMNVMNEEELTAFKFFIDSERERHVQDIIDIELLLYDINTKLGYFEQSKKIYERR